MKKKIEKRSVKLAEHETSDGLRTLNVLHVILLHEIDNEQRDAGEFLILHKMFFNVIRSFY